MSRQKLKRKICQHILSGKKCYQMSAFTGVVLKVGITNMPNTKNYRSSLHN